MPQIPHPENICLLRLSAVGDVCHTLPVVRTLQAHFPQTAFTWVIGKLEAGLVGDIPGIEFIIFDKNEGLGAYRQLRRTLSQRRFDVLLHMQMSLRASLASLCISARVKIGFDRRRAHDFQWLFTNRKIAYRPHQHVMESLFGFAEALGVEERVLAWDIPLADRDRAFARQSLPAGRQTLVISPCANPRFRNWRSWLPENYAAVADHAASRWDMQVVLTGGPSEMERRYGEEIIARTRHAPENLVGRTTLKQLAAVIERGTVLLSPDSGPVHIATAMGTPVIGLYATTNPDRAGPYQSQQWRVNRYPEAMRRFNRQDPDTARWGTRVRTAEAMTLIGVADVTTMLDRFMAQQVNVRV